MTRQEILQIAKPILFNTPMVGALLDNRKTATRRVVKKKFVDDVLSSPARLGNPDIADQKFITCLCNAPYEAGDYLYVRETWCWCPCWDCGMNTEKGCCDDTADRFYNDQKKENGCYGYKASFEIGEEPFDKWCPSIHMPKEAARLFLRVTDVRVERLQEITAEEIMREGAKSCGEYIDLTVRTEADTAWYKAIFEALWNSTIKKLTLGRYGWNANPWVWVIEFERVGSDEQ